MADTIYQQLRAHVHDLRLSVVAEQLASALEQAEQSGERSVRDTTSVRARV